MSKFSENEKKTDTEVARNLKSSEVDGNQAERNSSDKTIYPKAPVRETRKKAGKPKASRTRSRSRHNADVNRMDSMDEDDDEYDSNNEVDDPEYEDLCADACCPKRRRKRKPCCPRRKKRSCRRKPKRRC